MPRPPKKHVKLSRKSEFLKQGNGRSRSRSASRSRRANTPAPRARSAQRAPVEAHRVVDQARREVRAVVRHPMYRIVQLLGDDDEKKVVTAKRLIADQKGDDALIAMLQNTLSGARGVVRGLRLHGYEAMLTVAGSWVGSTATAFNTVSNIEPDNAGEWSTFAALFDECKVEEIRLEFVVMRSASAGVDTLISLGGIAYDPVDSTGYGSIQGVGEASQHILFQLPQVSATVQVQQAHSMHGMQRFVAKMPPGSQLESSGVAAGNVVTGMWSSTAQSNQCYGFIKPYMEAGATGASWTVRFVLFMRTAFRSRT